jgi:hypothetical protein
MSQARLALVRRLLDGGSLEAAAAAVADILDNEPDSSGARILSGEILLRRGEYSAARAAFLDIAENEALPDATAGTASTGLGAACQGLGDMEGAVAAFGLAIKRGADDTRTWLGLAEVLFAMGQWPALSELGRAAGSAVDTLTASAINLLVAVAAYMRDDLDGCGQVMDRFPTMAKDPKGLAAWRRLMEANVGARSMPEHRPLIATLSYRTYLEALLAFREAHPDLYAGAADDLLHLVGDSHSLAPAHTVTTHDGHKYRVQPHTVIGAKIWHLATDFNSSPSLQRAAFERVAASLPANAVVVAQFGEIDCRVREGLFPYLSRHPEVDRRDYCRGMAKAYVATLGRHLATEGRTVMVSGVPAPMPINVDKAGDQREAYLAMVAMINDALRDAAVSAGFRFLDPYALTVGADGVAHGRWRLDTVHLTPDHFAPLVSARG